MKRKISIDNTIRVQCAAEGRIVRFCCVVVLKIRPVFLRPAALQNRKIPLLCGRRFLHKCPLMAARRVGEDIPGVF